MSKYIAESSAATSSFLTLDSTKLASAMHATIQKHRVKKPIGGKTLENVGKKSSCKVVMIGFIANNAKHYNSLIIITSCTFTRMASKGVQLLFVLVCKSLQCKQRLIKIRTEVL